MKTKNWGNPNPSLDIIIYQLDHYVLDKIEGIYVLNMCIKIIGSIFNLSIVPGSCEKYLV